jgi:hypothetical protein
VDAVACAFIPAVAGIAASEWTEWVGTVSGAAIGAMAGQRVRRARIVHGAKSDKWTPELCPGTVDRYDTLGATVGRSIREAGSA